MDIWINKIKNKSIWPFTRTIKSPQFETKIITGNIQWMLVNNCYEYRESGLLDGIEFEQVYLFDFKNKQVLFEDKRLFYKFPKKNLIEEHRCGNDIYLVTADQYSIKYCVKGPNKDYTSETIFEI